MNNNILDELNPNNIPSVNDIEMVLNYYKNESDNNVDKCEKYLKKLYENHSDAWVLNLLDRVQAAMEKY